MKKLRLYPVVCVCLVLFGLQPARAQFLIEMLDTAQSQNKGLYYSLKKLDHIRMSGYIQPQFQVASEKGAKNYSGGDFAPLSNNRFMLRRGRIRFDYAGFTNEGKPLLQFVFQFDGTERGVAIRDFWGRYYESKFEMFAVTVGMFARPFGYEVNLSSSDREAPERGRASQILMRTERDMGGMLSFESRKHKNWLQYLKVDAGIFNGQGLSGPNEYDSYKDFIGRISTKPVPVSKKLSISAGLSMLEGGIIQNSKYINRIGVKSGDASFIVDSSASNIGRKAPRKYKGADVQFKIKHGWGATEIRAEYWKGTQTATAASSETPGTLLNEPYYIREFDAAFLLLLQNIINKKHQLGIKYDWYDPNTNVSGQQIGKAGTNFSGADVRYNTLGVGYLHYINENLKLVFWYDIIDNEATSLNGYQQDLDDNIFTFRMQFRF